VAGAGSEAGRGASLAATVSVAADPSSPEEHAVADTPMPIAASIAAVAAARRRRGKRGTVEAGSVEVMFMVAIVKIATGPVVCLQAIFGPPRDHPVDVRPRADVIRPADRTRRTADRA
jgi:hypothetical protein